MWVLPTEEEKTWRSVCHRAATDDLTFSQFRTDPIFNLICENNYPEWAGRQLAHAHNVWKRLPHYASVIASGEDFGAPVRLAELQLGGHHLSATACRHIKVLADIAAKNKGTLNELRIAEIGGGYGSLARMVLGCFPDCRYTAFDLAETLELQRRFISARRLEDTRPVVLPRCVIAETVSKQSDFEFDWVISTYALSELTSWARDIYSKQVLQASRHGYLCWNAVTQDDVLTADEAHEWLKSSVAKRVTREPEATNDGVTCLFSW